MSNKPSGASEPAATSHSNPPNERMQVVKSLTGFACAHRHFAASSHCRFVHGYERSFTLTIEGSVDKKTGWVIDFGAFQPLRLALENQFDHTLIIAPEDPLREQFEALAEAGGCQLRIMEHPGMEGAARWVWKLASTFINDVTDGRASLLEVEARESSHNAVRYRAERPT